MRGPQAQACVDNLLSTQDGSRGDSSGWSSTIVAALATVVLLILSWQARLDTARVQSDTAALAVLALAEASPGDICINATQSATGAKADLYFACEGPAEGIFHVALPLTDRYENQSSPEQKFSIVMMTDMIWSMSECGMLPGWYDKSILLSCVNTTGGIQTSCPPVSSSSMDVLAALDNITSSVITDFASANSATPSLAYYIFDLDPVESNLLVSVKAEPNLPRRNLAVYPQSRFDLGYNRSHIGHRNSLFNISQLALQGWFTNATLRLSMYDPARGASSAQFLWLNVYQDADTARCFGKSLNDTWGRIFREWYTNETTPSKSSAFMGIQPYDLRNSVYSGRPVYLMPASFEPYSCSSMVDALIWGDWANTLQAVQAAYSTTFISITGSYNDMNAIYTGALGALFGTFALGMCSLTCSTFQMLQKRSGQHMYRLRQHIWMATTADSCCSCMPTVE